MKILIGEISSYKAIVIARHLRLHYPNVEIWTYDYKPLVGLIHTRYADHYVRLSFVSSENYIRQIADYAKQINADVLIPVHSDYIGKILQNKHLFGHTLDYLGEYADYIQLHEKDRLMHWARELKIRVPDEYADVVSAKLPFVVKPTNMSSAKGVRYCFTEKQRVSIQGLSKNMLCQEYIEGRGCGYEVYCNKGQILVEYGHIRLAEWPVSGGSSVLRAPYLHPEMRPIAQRILQQIQWSGFAMFEFKLTKDNHLVLIEVNPRIWGSINQALQDGCPFFDCIVGDGQTD